MSDDHSEDLLHSIAYVLVAFAHGTDGRLVESEQGAIWRQLSARAEAHDLKDVEAALQIAVREYTTCSGQERIEHLQTHVETLRGLLDESERREVIEQLRAVAQSDGDLSPSEDEFICAVRNLFRPEEG